jgi:hypothetical protein
MLDCWPLFSGHAGTIRQDNEIIIGRAAYSRFIRPGLVERGMVAACRSRPT